MCERSARRPTDVDVLDAAMTHPVESEENIQNARETLNLDDSAVEYYVLALRYGRVSRVGGDNRSSH